MQNCITEKVYELQEDRIQFRFSEIHFWYCWLISLIYLNTGKWIVCVQPLKLYKTISIQPFKLFMSHILYVQDLDTIKEVKANLAN